MHKLVSGERLSVEETMVTAVAELIQQCTGVKEVPKIREIDQAEVKARKQLDAVVNSFFKHEANRQLYAVACPRCMGMLYGDYPMEILGVIHGVFRASFLQTLGRLVIVVYES